MALQTQFENWNADLSGICGHYYGVPNKHQRIVQGRVKPRRYGALDLADVAGDVDMIRRDRDGIRRDSSEHIFLIFQTSGELKVCHNGHRSIMQPGDSLLLDSTKEGQLIFGNGGGRLLSLHMPRHVFLAACDRRLSVGTCLDSKHPMASALRQQFCYLEPVSDADTAVTRASENLLFAMIGLAFSETGDMILGEAAQSVTTQYELAVHYIETNVTNEHICLGWLADRMKMSSRQLQRVFQESDTTFFQTVREKRMKLVAEHLQRRVGEKVSISGIAFDCGFRDLSTFNRGFRDYFGMSPRDYCNAMCPTP